MNNEKDEKYIFWTDKPSILYKNKKYLDLIPYLSMTIVERLNAITRFCMYLTILLLLLNKSSNWIQFPITIILLCIVIYYVFEYDDKGKLELLNIGNNMRRSDEQRDNIPKIEIGDYLPDGNLYFNTKPDEITYDYDDYKKYKKGTCKKPTEDNPFMNPINTDYELAMPPTACNADDDEIPEIISDSFNKNLFMDVSDVYARENSQRQYYTVPNINPPDQTEFAKWLYNTDNICKVNQRACLRYEDLTLYNKLNIF